MLFSFIVCYFTLSIINFSLDYKSPEIITVQGVEKKINSGARQPTTFNLYVTFNGKKTEIAVPSNVYYDSEINDLIEISLNEGFLGQAYYYYEK